MKLYFGKSTYREKKRHKWLLLFSDACVLLLVYELYLAGFSKALLWGLVGLMPLAWVTWYFYSYLPLKRGAQPSPEDAAIERAHWKLTALLVTPGVIIAVVVVLRVFHTLK